MKLWLKLLVVSIVMIAFGQFLGNHKAEAVVGRANTYGYFTNYNDDGSGDFVLPGGTDSNPSIPLSINTVAEFETFVIGEYNSTSTWRRTGGALIIQTMRGPDSSGNWDYGMPSATDIEEWKAQITDLIASGGSIDWGASNRYFNYTVNSYNITDHANSRDPAPDDVAFESDTDSEHYTIIFRDRNGTERYAIKHRCANPVGSLRGLPRVDWRLTGTTTANVATAAPGAAVTFTHTVRNAGPNTAHYDWVIQSNFPDTGPYSDTSSRISNVSTNSGASNPNNYLYRYTIPAGATAGQKYCMLVRFSDADGPGTATRNSTADCITVVLPANNPPVVTLTCNSTTYDLTGNARDPDRAGALSIQYYKDGAAIPTGSPTTSSTGAFSMNVSSYMTDGSPHTFMVTARGVNSAGTRDGVDGSRSVTCNPRGGRVSCNGQNMRPVISLPDAPVPTPVGAGNSGSTTPSGSTTTSNQQYAKEIPGDYQIDAAHDQYSPSTSIDTTSAAGVRQSSRNFTLNYDKYESSYPYDIHNTTIDYRQYYNQTLYYTSSAPDFYTCDRGYGSLSGSRCNYTGTANGWSCNAGDTNGGTSTCTHTTTTTTTIAATRTCRNNTTGAITTTTGNCPAGTTLQGYSCPANSGNTTYTGPDGAHNCTRRTTTTNTYAGTANNWRCNGTDGGGGSSSTCYYSATAHYNWHTGASSEVNSTNTYTGSPQLEQCYDRQFSVNSGAPTAASPPNYDSEDPYSATFQGMVGVDFSPDPGALPGSANIHQQNQVTLQYNAHYYYSNPDGSTGSLPGCNDDNNINITVTSPSFSNGTSSTALRTCSSPSPYSPPLLAGGQICVDYTFSPTGNSINRNGSITDNNGNSVTVTNCGSNLANHPYAHFFGLDVSAGGAFATGNNACSGTPMGSGDINTFVKGGGALTRGASTQFAAISLGNVNGFGTASLRGSAPNAQYGLTFANNGTIGHLGTNPCFPDYYSTIPTVTSSSAPDGRASGAYKLSSGSTIGGFSVSQGERITVYVNGDLSISNDITFNGANGGWNQATDVPSFYVYVTGNIYIDANVHNLDGVYIAQSNAANKGVIDTCANGFSSFAASALYDNCNSQLFITGSFIAHKIKFHRAFASLRNSLGGERPANRGGDCNANGDPAGNRSDTSYDCAGEIFITSPELFLSRPANSQASGPTSGKYDYITSLSPVL